MCLPVIFFGRVVYSIMFLAQLFLLSWFVSRLSRVELGPFIPTEPVLFRELPKSFRITL